MNKYIKNGLLFTGGFACCGVLYTRAVLKSKTFSNALTCVISRKIASLIYGETDCNPRYFKVSYRNYYDYKNPPHYHRNQTDNIIIETRKEAENVLNSLEELIDQYGVASVADLYDLVGLNYRFTDNKYGWTDIRNAKVIRVRDGYKLELPKCGPLI